MAKGDPSSAIAKPTGSPSQLDSSQTTTACRVLLQHIDKESKKKESESSKPNLLATKDDPDEESNTEEQNETPIWLILTTKKHITDQRRLKPNKIALPHPINNDITSSICLITADPQDTYNSLIKDPAFPEKLRSRITRVISLTNLKKNHKTFESRRKLLAEHDIFLADDRIVTYLPDILGKTFYKSGTKRPVPVNIAQVGERGKDGKRIKLDPASGKKINPDKIQGGRGAATPQQASKDIERALNSALVNLAPGTSTAIKVARAGFTPEMASENVQAVVNEMADKVVPQGWHNLRAVHIKGPNTMAFPIWLASELWVDEDDVLEEKKTYGGNRSKRALNKQKRVADAAKKDASTKSGLKRKADETTKPDAARHVKKKRKAESDEQLAAERALRQAKLRQQKAKALAEVL